MARDIQVVVPMAGLGTRFSDMGYRTPKPLLPINGKPMFELVLFNLLTDRVVSVTIVARKEWQLSDYVEKLQHKMVPQLELVEVDDLTEGPAATVELAKPHLRPDLPVVTGNSDQYVDADLTRFYSLFDKPSVQGTVLTMEDDDPKWSYASIDDHGQVHFVKEKQVISKFATVGIYGFRSAELMFTCFDLMRRANDRVNGELYVAPSFNYITQFGGFVSAYNLGPISTVMHGLGTPEDYTAFLASDVCRRLPGDYWT